MGLKIFVTALAAAAAIAMLAAPADAAPKKKRVVAGSGHTVFVSRDEDGRTRTRIIIQKRSYLDPGTESFPGENVGHDYVQLPNAPRHQRARQHGLRQQPVAVARPVHADRQE